MLSDIKLILQHKNYTNLMTELFITLTILAIATIWIYNLLVKDRNQVLAAWSDIDVQLKRRYELVPQLVTTVKAYADFEKATMTAVTELRSRSKAETHLPEKSVLETAMASAIGQLIIIAEDYPELKADGNFRQLQTELTEIEDHVQYSRRFYNGAVRIFNTRIESFPNFIIARLFNFNVAEYFEVNSDDERKVSVIKLNE